MKTLIERKADVTHTDRHGAGALHYLLTSKNKKEELGSSVALLLKHGVSLKKTKSEVRHLVGATIPKEMTPLALAAYRNHYGLHATIQKKQVAALERQESEELIATNQELSQTALDPYGHDEEMFRLAQ